jgi:hypothetical protein
MYAVKLLELTQILGLPQADIARHFGLTRTQVHLWAAGKRPVPRRYREALVHLVATASAQCRALAARESVGILGEIARQASGAPARPRPVDRFDAMVTEMLDAWVTENLEAHDLGPTASVQGVIEALDPFKDMTQEALRKPSNARRLHTLAASLIEHATMLQRLSPMQDVLEENV